MNRSAGIDPGSDRIRDRGEAQWAFRPVGAGAGFQQRDECHIVLSLFSLQSCSQNPMWVVGGDCTPASAVASWWREMAARIGGRARTPRRTVQTARALL